MRHQGRKVTTVWQTFEQLSYDIIYCVILSNTSIKVNFGVSVQSPTKVAIVVGFVLVQ